MEMEKQIQLKNIENILNKMISSSNVTINTNANYIPNTNANLNTSNNIKYNNNEVYCSNCGNNDHFFKSCNEPVHSYGLLCFYKKKTMVKDTSITNDFFNKKTKKSDYSLKSKKQNNNLHKIKILKRHETISHTLKNMLGIVGNNLSDSKNGNTINDIIDDTNRRHDEIDGIIDIDDTNEILDSNSNNNNIDPDNNTTVQQPMKEVMTQKVLLVQRRNTIGLIEFIRGKYEVSNPEYIIKLFNMMTFDEKRIFREYDNFDMIRTMFGFKRENNYRTEYNDSKTKFNELKDNIHGNQVHALLDKSYTKWSSPEWGVPKGRRSNKEFDIECAIREFVEETCIKSKNINVYRNIKPLEEIYKGINGVVYKHTYFIADIKDTPEADENIIQVEKGGFINHEVSNVKCFNLTECHRIIRPYYLSKLNAIKKGFQIIHCMNTYFE